MFITHGNLYHLQDQAFKKKKKKKKRKKKINMGRPKTQTLVVLHQR